MFKFPEQIEKIMGSPIVSEQKSNFMKREQRAEFKNEKNEKNPLMLKNDSEVSY